MKTPVTVSEILEADWLRRWRPEVIVGSDSIRRAVRWLQVVETFDGAAATRRGDVVLSTGSMLDSDCDGARRLARVLGECGALALFAAVVPASPEAARALAEECRAQRLALVTLHPSLCVTELAERVQRMLADRDVDNLALSDELRTRFAKALRSRARVGELLAVAAEYGGCPVVLESPAGKLLAAESGPWRRADAVQFWYRTRGPALRDGSAKERAGSVAAEVGSPEGMWGRLVLCGYTGPRQRGVLLAERAAEAVSVRRMLAPGKDQSDDSSADLLHALIAGQLEPDEAAIRLQQAGLDVGRRSCPFPAPHRWRDSGSPRRLAECSRGKAGVRPRSPQPGAREPERHGDDAAGGTRHRGSRRTAYANCRMGGRRGAVSRVGGDVRPGRRACRTR
ncbi:PucR family transcriptional regulator ligand-binding domain-containing protein [Amycolatopsis jejuensis]|uniref:PucR family transcriptional regulator ligand-binding domain-containing protein n=1 Tax=Amycolatopsis jejuensis TaxID=330084 RepID=UPI000525C3F7|nr:PucR family transcriptional regulator ligand-binding domain-containing protein [Amycolatopsis jejuensis]